MDPVFLGQLLLNGIVIGLIYGLIATGLTLQFGILHIVNFAHGEVLMVAMYAMAALLPLFGGDFFVAFAVLVVLASAVSLLAARGLLAALATGGDGGGIFEKSLLLTLGVSIVLVNGVQQLFTSNPQMATTSFGYGAFALGEIRLTYAHALASVVAVVTFGALFWFLLRTNAGRALRAVAQNREAALMIGLDPTRVARRAVAVSLVLSAVAGAVLVPIIVFQPTVGQTLLLKAFAVVVIGGMGNIGGAVAVALGLGVLESLVGGFADIVWQNAVAFVAMIAVLAMRPQGLFAAAIRKG
ncbi:amino acid/amide ABC transporter membrane protein 1, HAAT family [Tistlia consotensis]|uniref:Amino acid/amide ABC transporter membrane protein 1, HAAT family n=1 Tax=Tistlia consotensis USBA 355 TaxID=560819 RepID=A0A1Y6CBU4_9PROT|nr:branched-chain amino acid ABC transporter permease [Tistlia consotensis]SMF47473.1 amino acid/amide ABC transporter membrane protein 1, HAAT family [Tistlia consotensis USBA 355]SNR82442.1 amino acid/amide ABC transporter membrane protein 1, HAAT family [Tistlia consotensis]